MIFQVHGIQRIAGVAVFMSNKIDFKVKKETRDKDRHFLIIKGTIHQEDIKAIDIYVSNLGAPTYIKQLLTDFKERN